MANTRKRVNKPASVAQFPQSSGAVAVQDIPQAFQEPAEPKIEMPAAPNRSPLKKKTPTLPQEGDFFKRVASVAQSDWDSGRVYLYLYVLEPLCNLKQQGGKAYFNRYSSPIRDEHQIAVECGSGRYRLMLSYNRVSPEDSSEMARHEFEIFNPQYPPKVPKAAWINDPRNAKWESLLPPAPAAPAAAGSVVEAMRLVTDLRRDLREEMEPETAPPNTASEMLTTMKIAKDLFGTPAAAPGVPAKDPLEIAVALFTTMNQMKAENPVIDMYRDELKAMREELKEARQPTAAPAKSLIDQIKELAALGDALKPIKDLLGFGGAGEAIGRVAKTTGYDMFRDFINSPAGSAVGQGAASLMMNLAARAPGNGGMPPQPMQQRPPVVLNPQQPDGTAPQEDVEQRVQRIGQIITQPMIYEFFLKEQPGEIFAQQMFDMWPEDYLFMRGLGAENIIARYRQFPPAWAVIAPKEPAFIQFIQEFCAWDPNEDEAPAPEPGDDGVTDLDPEGAN